MSDLATELRAARSKVEREKQELFRQLRSKSRQELRRRDLPISRPRRIDLSGEISEAQKRASEAQEEFLAKSQQAFEETHVKLDTGDYVMKEAFERLTPEYQTKLKELGVEGFNAWVTEENQKFESEHVKLDNDEWVTKESFESLTLELQTQLMQSGVEEFNKQQQANIEAFTATHIEIRLGEWVTKESYESLTSKRQIQLRRFGVEGFNAMIEEERRQFEAANIQLQSGEWVSRAEWDKLDATAQDYIMRRGIEHGIELYNQYLDWQYSPLRIWRAHMPDGSTIHIYAATRDEAKAIAKERGASPYVLTWVLCDKQQTPELYGERLFANMQYRGEIPKNAIYTSYNPNTNEVSYIVSDRPVVKIATGEYVDKELWESLSQEAQARINEIGVGAWRAEFEATHVETKPGEWISSEFWAQLAPEQQKQVTETGTYTVVLSSREQFDTLKAQGNLPIGAYYIESVSDNPADGFHYGVFNSEWGEYLDSPNQFIPAGITAEELADITGLSVTEVKARLETRQQAIDEETEATGISPSTEVPDWLKALAATSGTLLMLPEAGPGEIVATPVEAAVFIATAIVIYLISNPQVREAIAQTTEGVSGWISSMTRRISEGIKTETRPSTNDVDITKIETNPSTGNIEIILPQTAVGGMVQTYVVPQTLFSEGIGSLGSIRENSIQAAALLGETGIDIIDRGLIIDKLKKTGISMVDRGIIEDIFTKTGVDIVDRGLIIDVFEKTGIEFVDTGLIRDIFRETGVEFIDEGFESIPLIRQQMEDTILKATAVAGAASRSLPTIPTDILTPREVERLKVIRERYVSALRDTVAGKLDSGELRVHTSDARYAIHEILDALLTESRINQMQYDLYLRQLQAGEKSAQEMLEWLERYFGATEYLQAQINNLMPSDFSPLQRELATVAVLVALSQSHNLPAPKSDETLNEYMSSNFITPGITTEIAKPATITTEEALTQEEELTRELTEATTQAVLQAQTRAAMQNLTAIQTMAAVKVAAQTAVQAATATSAAVQSLSQTAVRTAARTAAKEAVRAAEATGVGTRVMEKPLVLAEEEGKEERPIYPDGTIVWRMGELKRGDEWKIIPPPYDLEKPISSRYPPAGVTRLQGTPQETLTFIGGALPFKDVAFDLGVVDGFIDVKKQRIRFTGKGEATNVGKRLPGTTTGITLGDAIEEEITMAKMNPVKFANRISGTRKRVRRVSRAPGLPSGIKTYLGRGLEYPYYMWKVKK